MTELIAIIILVFSLLGMGVIILRKIPILVTLPEVVPKKKKESLISRLKKEIKKINPFRNFSYEIFLQKILSKIKILSLKSENKTSGWLQKLREKSQRKKSKGNDNYWEEIKKSTKNK